jgi:hypothetical protein
MFLAITKLVLLSKKEQMKKQADQPSDSINLNGRPKKQTGGKKCC